MKIPMSVFSTAIETLLRSDARSSTVYMSASARVTATRLFKPDARNRHTTIAVTFGQLNYAGREFVKLCKKAGEPLPVRKAQLRFWSKPRKKKVRKG